jgi:hypothetical protein
MISEPKELWDLADFLRVATVIVRNKGGAKTTREFKSTIIPIDDISRRFAHIELTKDSECTMRCGPTHAYLNGKDGLSAVYELYASNLKQIPLLSSGYMDFFKGMLYDDVMDAFDLIMLEAKLPHDNLAALLKKEWNPTNSGKPVITTNWRIDVDTKETVDVLCFPSLFFYFKQNYNGNPSETWKQTAENVFPWDPDYALRVVKTAWDVLSNQNDTEKKMIFGKWSHYALETNRFNNDSKGYLTTMQKAFTTMLAEKSSATPPTSSPNSNLSKEDTVQQVEMLFKNAQVGSSLKSAINKAKTDDERKKVLKNHVLVDANATKRYYESIMNFLKSIQ